MSRDGFSVKSGRAGKPATSLRRIFIILGFGASLTLVLQLIGNALAPEATDSNPPVVQTSSERARKGGVARRFWPEPRSQASQLNGPAAQVETATSSGPETSAAVRQTGPAITTSLQESDAGGSGANSEEAERSSVLVDPSFARLRIAFKRSHRSRGRIIETWGSPSTFTASQTGNRAEVEAKAELYGPNGIITGSTAEWTPADRGMVSILRSAGEGNLVTITVRYPGQSNLYVTQQGYTNEFSINASESGGGLRVAISQVRRVQ